MPPIFHFSFEKRAVLAVIAISLLFPAILVLTSGNVAYYLNVIFFNQKIFLISSLFVFLTFFAFKEKIKPQDWKPPDTDDTISCLIVSFALILLLGVIHVDFDTLLSLEKVNVAENTMWVGFGSFLSDSFDLDRIPVGTGAITKVIDLKQEPNEPATLRLHSGWEGGKFDTNVLVTINQEYIINLTPQYLTIKSGEPSWIEVNVPKNVLQSGRNYFELSKSGPAYVFLSSQYVYHDAKTLREDGSYYGQEALIYLRKPFSVSQLFGFAFDYQLLMKIWAIAFLLLALFGKDCLLSICRRYGIQLLALFLLSIAGINAILYVQTQWRHLSLLTGEVIAYLLSPFMKIYRDFGDPAGPVLGVETFYIRIFKSCSGIESMAVFSILFVAMVSFNIRRINKTSIPFLFLIGVAGTFLVNVLRLICLVLVGAFISPELAVNAFHTNVGWVMMLVYFAGFNEMATRFFVRRDAP